MKIFKTLFSAALVVGMAAGPVLDACTPERKDTWGRLEVWCCCDSSYQRCALFLIIPNAEHGAYIGEQPIQGYCGGKGDLEKTEDNL